MPTVLLGDNSTNFRLLLSIGINTQVQLGWPRSPPVLGVLGWEHREQVQKRTGLRGVWGDKPIYHPWRNKSYPEWKCLNACGTWGSSLGKDEASRQKGNLGRHLPLGDWAMWRKKSGRDKIKSPAKIKESQNQKTCSLPALQEEALYKKESALHYIDSRGRDWIKKPS